jgi:Mg2+-importing ATPase
MQGAPEEIYKKCTQYELDGQIYPLDDKKLIELEKPYYKLSRDGFRVLGVAYKKVQNDKDCCVADESGLILKGYMGFLDPAKPSTKEVLDALKDRGVEVKILTGDNELVTQKVCSDVGLKIKGTILGTEIDKMDEVALRYAAETTTIFARMAPMQKQRVIEALRLNRHVVGYLGDGINDAPSLKAADVGISVNNAVDIAKESADIILLEKSLMVLHDGIDEGRKTFGNITKYIKMSASSNFGNMLSVTIATLFLPFLPMLPIQILLNNFLYDLSQITIPSDGVDPEFIKKPRPWNVDFIKHYMLYIGPISSIFDLTTFAIMWYIFGGHTMTPEAQMLFHTGWFLESLCSQTLVIYVIRTNKLPFIQSRPSKLIIFSTILILLFAFYIPFSSLAIFFGLVAPPLLYFIVLGAIILMYLTTVQLMKNHVIKKYGYY